MAAQRSNWSFALLESHPALRSQLGLAPRVPPRRCTRGAILGGENTSIKLTPLLLETNSSVIGSSWDPSGLAL
eukprot:4371402-Pyramimonas_sp.AAC.1